MPSPRTDQHQALARQSLPRAVTDAEMALAAGLEQIFKSGVGDFDQVATLLQQNGIQPPSATQGPWTLQLLHDELARINASMDEAYRAGGASASAAT